MKTASEKELDRAARLLRRSLRAFKRPQWQDGPTDDEVCEEITHFLAELKLRRRIEADMAAGYPERKGGRS